MNEAAVQSMTVRRLCGSIEGVKIPDGAGDLEVAAVADDSRSTGPRSLFIAVPGERIDGRDHAPDAVARGAVAVVAEAPVEVGVPVVRVPDARLALAHVAAEWHGRPADALRMVGITGTVGKTSVMTMLGHILAAARIPAGTIGSLGIHFPGHADATPNTTPGALKLQQTFADMVSAGTDVAAMEVTSHALAQQRVRGVHYDVGIFTNLVMLEHMEYHGTFAEYARVKARFLDMLLPEAPLIYASGDRAVRQIVRRHRGPRISCGGGGVWVSLRREGMDVNGTRLTLTLRRPLPLIGGGCVDPTEIPLELRTLGRPNMINATLAAVTALTLGARTDTIRSALAAFEPPRRRMEVIRRDGPIIIDDTVGHPDSFTAIFEVASRIPHRKLRVACVVRGQRGAEINARDAEALTIWSRRVPIDVLAVTAAADTADERNTVTAEEHAAFTDKLRQAGLRFTSTDRLDEAIHTVMNGVGSDDLVLLLGAQGMDAGAEIALRSAA